MSMQLCMLYAGATGNAEQGSAPSGGSSRPMGASRKAEDPDSMASMAMDVALAFLFKAHLLPFLFCCSLIESLYLSCSDKDTCYHFWIR